MNIVLFDDPQIKKQLLPLTYLRPVADIRVGIRTIREKWDDYTGMGSSSLTDEYLSVKFAASDTGDNLLINGCICPDDQLWDAVSSLEPGDCLGKKGMVVACRSKTLEIAEINMEYEGEVLAIEHTWDIFANNGDQIRYDFNRITRGRESQPITDPHTVVYAPENVFVEEGVEFKAAIINAEDGPIYIGKDAKIQEGAIMRGPISVGEGSHINMNAKVRSNTTIGPFCRAGGEINNVVMFGYSNKGHEGFLGNAVVAEWCNIGADTNNSNLKNNYAEVKMWDYAAGRFVNTGRQFCGLVLGDHTKCGINTMFNTGTVVGIGANIFGSGFPRNFIPSFSWGGAGGLTTYRMNRFVDMTNNMMERRDMKLTEEDEAILSHIFSLSSENRNF